MIIFANMFMPFKNKMLFFIYSEIGFNQLFRRKCIKFMFEIILLRNKLKTLISTIGSNMRYQYVLPKIFMVGISFSSTDIFFLISNNSALTLGLLISTFVSLGPGISGFWR